MLQKPLVIDDGQLERLQSGDDLDIPLEDRVRTLARLVDAIVDSLIANGIDMLPEVLALAKEVQSWR